VFLRERFACLALKLWERPKEARRPTLQLMGMKPQDVFLKEHFAGCARGNRNVPSGTLWQRKQNDRNVPEGTFSTRAPYNFGEVFLKEHCGKLL
jgi:hypothetical protein